MQTMGFRPYLRAALIRWLTVSSVSPKYWRRSLWPMMTYSTPISFSIAPEISPVYAPLSAQWMFWAPTLTLDPFRISTAVARLVKVGQTAISHLPANWAREAFRAEASSAVSAAVLFIFQLPAIKILRAIMV